MKLCTEYENLLIENDEILEIISDFVSHDFAMRIFYDYAGVRLFIPYRPREGRGLASEIGLENIIALSKALGHGDVEIKSQTYLFNKLKLWQLLDEYKKMGKPVRGKKGRFANLIGISTRSVQRYHKQYFAYKRQNQRLLTP